MKTLKEINKIIAKMDDEVFERINEADGDYFFGKTSQERNNGYKRMIYNLKKYNLTKEEWWAWCAE